MKTMFGQKSIVTCVLAAMSVCEACGDSIRVEARRGRRSCGEETIFQVSLLDDTGALKTSGKGTVTLDNFGPTKLWSEPVDFSDGNPRAYRGKLNEPGFLRLTVDVPGVSRDPDGKPCAFSVPYENDRIVSGTSEPPDFDDVWARTLAEAEKEPLDVQMRKEPLRSSEKWTMYRVSFASIGRRLFCWLSIPKGNGPWPAKVVVPGAGAEEKDLLPEGIADQVKLTVDAFSSESRRDREENIYRSVIAGAVRAARWLKARSEVDPMKISYAGCSQGGGCGWGILALASDVFAEGRLDVPVLTATPYFDSCNFAPRVKCPVTVIAGLGDWVCPPANVCAAYNRMTAPGRRLVLAYGANHWTAGRVASEDLETERKAYTAIRPADASRPEDRGGLIAPEDADYVRRKFREDVTEPGNGLDNEALCEGSFKIARESFAADGNWQLAKAKAFAWLCAKMGVSASEHDIFPSIACFQRGARPLERAVVWRNRAVDEKYLPKESEAVREGRRRGRFEMWKDFDHSVPPWDELLAGGWPMIEARLNKYDRGTPYYQALRITLNGCYRALERFAAAARKAAASASTAEKRARLLREAEAFERIRKAPPRTCYEAMAFQWSYFFLSEHVDNLQVRSLGALDILYTPFYRADLAAGRVTPESFKRDLAYFWWQWGSIDNYWGQPVALGGTKADGTTEFNEVSDLILDVHDALALPTPKMLVKIATNTPDRVFDRMLDMAARHRSITFDGEEGMRRSLKGWRHCTDEECRTCDLNGCYEFYAHGVQNETQSSHISYLQPVADLLARAKDGAFEADSYEAFKAAYFGELKRNTLECCDLTDAWERYLGDINPGNIYSLAVESAVRDGKDAFCTGLKYNDTALLSVGLGTTVDALLAVKEIVYERREMTLGELGELMAADWQGNERLRQRMLRSKRKWGNNDAEANGTGSEIIRNISSWVNGRPNARGGIWGFSGHPARQFIELMRHTGATPDGRKAGEESSKNLSPTMGVDTEGVTALINTLSNLRPEDLPVNFPLDVQLLPATVRGQEGIAAMRTLARIYFANGGETLQFNVLDIDELKDAQKRPWKYENLQVRVCGWNVRWNDLCKAEQDAYIRRAEMIAQ